MTNGQCQTTKHLQCGQDHALHCSQTTQNTKHRRKRWWWMTSAECSTAITLHVAVNAPGNSLPTFLVFQRVQQIIWARKGQQAQKCSVNQVVGW